MTMNDIEKCPDCRGGGRVESQFMVDTKMKTVKEKCLTCNGYGLMLRIHGELWSMRRHRRQVG